MCEFDDCYDDYEVNKLAASKLAKDSRKRKQREQEDSDYAYEQRCIDYLERDNDDCMF